MLTAFLPDQIKQFHQQINSIESSSQFMIEEEANGSTPSLDTKVIPHDDGSLLTTVFRKQTHANRYVDFTHLTTKLQWSEPCLPVQTRSVLSSQTRTQREHVTRDLRITLPEVDGGPELAPYIQPSPVTRAGPTQGSCESSIRLALVRVHSKDLQPLGQL